VKSIVNVQRALGLLPALVALIVKVESVLQKDSDQGKQVSAEEAAELALAAATFIERVVAVIRGA
jgi:hypothetical protein